jgi:hypothetical protein
MLCMSQMKKKYLFKEDSNNLIMVLEEVVKKQVKVIIIKINLPE